MLFSARTGIDDLNNVQVLTIAAACLAAAVVGYLLAWRSKRTFYRTAGSLMTAVVAGFAGLFMLVWLISAVMPLPPPDGSSLWGPVVFVLASSPLPLGALYISAKFLRRALRAESN
jgi:CHASE2 domain-containing sensor protein